MSRVHEPFTSLHGGGALDARYGRHTVYNIASHFVWVTTYRDTVLTGDVAVRVRALVRHTCAIFETTMLQGVVSKDHGHILVSAPPHMAPREILRRITGRSARKLFEEFPLLKKRSWGRHFWARGYVCATGGPMTDEVITEYLEQHFEPNPADNFRTESSQWVLDPYPDVQSLWRTHQLFPGGCAVPVVVRL